MPNVDVARWEWVFEPWKAAIGLLRLATTALRWRTRISVPPMSDAWLREYQQHAGKHDDTVSTL